MSAARPTHLRARRAQAAPWPHWRGAPLAAVLLDLDGTLVDSADGIARALAATLREFDLPVPAPQAVRAMIGGGAAVLVERALRHQRRGAGPVLQQALTTRFLQHYDALLAEGACGTRVFDGVAEGLRALRGLGLRLAVVTNKQRASAARLLDRLGLMAQLDALTARDDCEHGKPLPDPLLHACRALGIAPAAALMVGDSMNDVAAARAAGVPVVCVPYGYAEGRDARTLPADACVETLAALPALLLAPLLAPTRAAARAAIRGAPR